MARKVWFAEYPGGMHGMMMFKPQCVVYVLDPTRTHSRRFRKLFTTTSKAEAEARLSKRHPYRRDGWDEVGPGQYGIPANA